MKRTAPLPDGSPSPVEQSDRLRPLRHPPDGLGGKSSDR